jgi:phage tail-like protein
VATVEDTQVETAARLSTSVKRDFSTTRVRLRVADDRTPPIASMRALLREPLPELYRDGGFGMRFLEGLETVLDPIIGTLDALPVYFDPDLAPRDMLDLMAAWLGLTVDESWGNERVRDALRLAGRLGQQRGTKRGLELVLRISFPDLPLRVEDTGKVTWSADPDSPVESAANGFVVYCDETVDEVKQAEIARVIEQAKPLHVRFRLRVRAPKKRTEGEGR